MILLHLFILNVTDIASMKDNTNTKIESIELKQALRDSTPNKIIYSIIFFWIFIICLHLYIYLHVRLLSLNLTMNKKFVT